jgi:hypothetical protein
MKKMAAQLLDLGAAAVAEVGMGVRVAQDILVVVAVAPQDLVQYVQVVQAAQAHLFYVASARLQNIAY